MSEQNKGPTGRNCEAKNHQITFALHSTPIAKSQEWEWSTSPPQGEGARAWGGLIVPPILAAEEAERELAALDARGVRR